MNYISGWDTLDWFAWMIMMIVLLATIQSGFNFGSGLIRLLLSLRQNNRN